MSDTDLDKERVYVAYREIFKDTLQPSTLTRYLPNPVPTDDDDESTDYGTVPSDYEWE
jgi:hypothetical protein